MYRLLTAFWIAALFFASHSSGRQDRPPVISAINIYGCQHTDTTVIRTIIRVKPGDVFDSLQLETIRTRLKRLNIFSKVEVFSQTALPGPRIMIIVVEQFRWGLNAFGGELYSMLYGRPVEGFWWNAWGGLTNSNFRGQAEQFSFAVSFPRRLSAGVSWMKPFIGTPFFFKTGGGVSHAPDLYIPWNRFSLYGYTTMGRAIGQHGRLYTSLMPNYGRRWYKGPAGYWDTLGVDTTRDLRISSQPWGALEYDRIGLDTMQVATLRDTHGLDTGYVVARRQWNGYSSQRIAQREAPYKELFLILGWSSDRRASTYDIQRGTYLGITLLTNALYPRDRTYTYLQTDIDARGYLPGIRPGDALAARIRATVRVDTSDIYDGLYAGGESNLRGYPLGYFPRGFIANNQVFGSVEYRAPLFATPVIDLFFLSALISDLRNFYYRLDAALFFDAGYQWHHLPRILHPRREHSWGADVGAGLRAQAPTLRRTLCFDFAWGLDREWNDLKKRLLRHPWLPEWYLYVDMKF